MSKVHLSTHNQKKLALMLIVLGLAMGILAIGLSLRSNISETKPSPGALTSRSAPTSVKPASTSFATFSVPPTDPKYISIPAIGVGNTPVLQLGLTSGGAIALPDNIYETDW